MGEFYMKRMTSTSNLPLSTSKHSPSDKEMEGV